MITSSDDDIRTALSGKRITQFLRLLIVVHNFLQLRHVRPYLFHLALQFLQMLADDIHAEVKYQVLDTLTQQIAIAIHLKTTAQLMAVDT